MGGGGEMYDVIVLAWIRYHIVEDKMKRIQFQLLFMVLVTAIVAAMPLKAMNSPNLTGSAQVNSLLGRPFGNHPLK